MRKFINIFKMKEKKRVIPAFVMAGLLAIVNILFFYYKVKPSLQKAMGEIPKAFYFLNAQMIIFIIAWIIILAVVFFNYKNLKGIKGKKTNESYYSSIKRNIKKRHRFKKGHTDIDLLYSLLKDRKHLKIPAISRIFNIDNEKALEWCKILEDSGLAVINYPAFSEPEIEIK